MPQEDPIAIGSPEWWLQELEKRLYLRQQGIDVLEGYYEGDHPLMFASDKFQEAFGGLFREFSDNFCGLVVDAVEERLNPAGFRFPAGDSEALPDEEALAEATVGDSEAWRIWQANQLDRYSVMAHQVSLYSGESSVLIWNDPADEKTPRITVEHPKQMIVGYSAGNPHVRAAALKLWLGDDGLKYATLYMPDAVYKFVGKTASQRKTGSTPLDNWAERGVEGEDWPLPNPLGVVPVVPLQNKPRLLPRTKPIQQQLYARQIRMTQGGISEIEDIVPIQNAINKLCCDMMVAAEFAAFRQRYITGMDIPIDPETNQPLADKDMWKFAVQRILMIEHDKDQPVTVGEFGVTDLVTYVKGIEMLVQHAATKSRTPPHYLLQAGPMPSGESLRAAETGLVAKAKRKMVFYGEDWEEIMRIAFAVIDDPRSKVMDNEIIWGDPESRTEGQHVDAQLKKQSLGIPEEQSWEDLGYSPTQIKRMLAMKEAQIARGALGTTMVFDPIANQWVQRKDQLAKHEVPPTTDPSQEVRPPAPAPAA